MLQLSYFLIGSAIYLDANCTGYEFSLKQCQLNDKEIQIVQDCMAVSFLSCYGKA